MDENSIIITLQFLYDCAKKEKNGPYEYKTYDLDIIVPKNITCDDLMDAIKYGLLNTFADVKRKDKREISFTHENVKRIASDSRWCFVVPDSENEELEPDYSDYHDTEMLAICINIFDSCYKRYCENAPAESDTVSEGDLDAVSVSDLSPDRIKSVYDLGAVSIASVNPLVYREDALLSEAHNDQIWLRRDIKAVSVLKCDSDDMKEEFSNKNIGDIELQKIGFISGTRVIFDVYNAHGGRFLFQGEINPAFIKNIPEYNISDRPIYELDTEPIKIIPPTDPPQKSRQNFVAMLLSPLLMMGSMLVVRLFASSGSGMNATTTVIMSIAMVGATMLLGLVNWIFQKKSYKDAVKEWLKQYQDYIRSLTVDIVARQQSDVKKLNELYPPVYESDYNEVKIDGLISKALYLHGDIFGRSRKHPDFLRVRLGTAQKSSGLVPSVFEIIGEKKDVLFSPARYKNLGSTDKRHDFSIALDEKEKDTDGALVDLPSEISRKYSYLGDVSGSEKAILPPVILDIKQCGTVGIIRQPNEGNENDYLQALIDNIVFDLCFHQNPGDLQFCVFFDETDDWNEQQYLVNKYRHLPHFRELLGGFSSLAYKDNDEFSELSQFIFNKKDANRVFDRIHEIVIQRKSEENADRYPQIVMIFIGDYQLKSHQLSEYLYDFQSENEEREDFGLSFVFCTEYFEKLPKYCGKVIEIRSKNSRDESRLPADGKYSMRLLPHVRNLENHKSYSKKGSVCYSYPDEEHSDQYWFESDVLSPPDKSKKRGSNGKTKRDDYYRAFKTLSALYYFRIAQGAGVPSLVELSELHNEYGDLLNKAMNTITTEENEDGDTASSLEPIDADEKAGISESITATEVNLVTQIRTISENRDIKKSLAVPIGFKSGGESVILDLHEKHDGPHMLVAGTTGSGKSEAILTYLIGLCMCYTPKQVNLLLVDMKGGDFIRRIGRLPHVVGTVSDIDSVATDDDFDTDNTEYMLSRFLRSMKAEIRRRKKLFKELNVKDIDEYIKKQKNNQNCAQLPHLFLVVDEFTELMQFSEDNPNIDFKKEISSLARIGRSLGFHIILISQNIEGAITDNIRVNSRARLCFKVATKEASKEMIGSEAAADPLMPGFGRGFLYVGNGARSDYFQAAYSGASAMTNSKQRILIPLVERSGRYSVFYNSYLHNESEKDSKAKADAVGTQIDWFASFVCSLFTDGASHQVLQPLLNTTITLKEGFDND